MLEEYVYVDDRIGNIENPLSQIALSLAKYLETGQYVDTTRVAFVHYSPYNMAISQNMTVDHNGLPSSTKPSDNGVDYISENRQKMPSSITLKRLNEKYYNPATEPMIDRHIGEYNVLDGAYDEHIICDLSDKGWVEDIRMYSAIDKGGKTFCLYRRKDNGKYFFVEVFDDNRDEYLHAKQVGKKDVPTSVWDDAISLIQHS